MILDPAPFYYRLIVLYITFAHFLYLNLQLHSYFESLDDLPLNIYVLVKLLLHKNSAKPNITL